MKNDFNTSFFNNFLQRSPTSKKQIAVYLDDNTIQQIDLLSKVFSNLSDTKGFSRNTIIETAVHKFLKESKDYLLDTEGIDFDELLEDERSEGFDTVILASRGRGFEETFLGEAEPACWYPCRISDAKEQHLKYIAVYRGQPISAITHYAKIKEFKKDPEKGCKVCYFEDSPIELPHKINLGTKDSCYFVGAKYTTLESLLNATKADELFFG